MGEDRFFVSEILNRPNYLLIFWCLTIFGIFWLLLALMIDQIVTAEILLNKTSADTPKKQTYWCGWQAVKSQNSHFNNYKYTTCDEVICATNYSAGQVWVSFNIMAVLLGCTTLGYGLFLDIRQGGCDMSSIRHIADKLGCTCSFGYTTLGTIVLLCWQLVGLIIYGGAETCSKQTMWNSLVSPFTISTFSSAGGGSMGLDILSLIFFVLGVFVLLSIRIQYKQLPRSKMLSGDNKQISSSIKSVEKEEKEKKEKKKKLRNQKYKNPEIKMKKKIKKTQTPRSR